MVNAVKSIHTSESKWCEYEFSPFMLLPIAKTPGELSCQAQRKDNPVNINTFLRIINLKKKKDIVFHYDMKSN